jgi:hypothetical protein
MTGDGFALDDRLKGWKEIGDFLHTCGRTAQRWERCLQLPIHRIPTSKSAIVFASRAELHTWLQVAETASTKPRPSAMNAIPLNGRGSRGRRTTGPVRHSISLRLTSATGQAVLASCTEGAITPISVGRQTLALSVRLLRNSLLVRVYRVVANQANGSAFTEVASAALTRSAKRELQHNSGLRAICWLA